MDDAKRQAAWKNLEILLKRLKEGSARRDGGCGRDDVWLERVLAEHERRAFYAVLVSDSAAIPDGVQDVLVASNLTEQDLHWNPDYPSLERTPALFADQFGPLFRHVRELRIIDPYFDVPRPDVEPTKKSKGWSQPLSSLLRETQKDRIAQEAVSVDVFTSVDRYFKGKGRMQTAEAEQLEAKALIDATIEMVRPLLAMSQQFRIHVWSDQSHPCRERLHDRWVLAETGGVTLGYGFDMPGVGSTDPTLLSRSQWLNRWTLYSPDSTTFRVLASASCKGERAGD
jgi:hypothetical protein